MIGRDWDWDDERRRRKHEVAMSQASSRFIVPAMPSTLSIRSVSGSHACFTSAPRCIFGLAAATNGCDVGQECKFGNQASDIKQYAGIF